MLVAVSALAVCGLAAAAPEDSAGRPPALPRGVQRKVGDKYDQVVDCGDGWFSMTDCDQGNIDSGKVCKEHGYTGIDKFGGNWGNLCSKSVDGNGNCEWGSVNCGCTVDFHCTGMTQAPTEAPTTTPAAPTPAPTLSEECEAAQDDVAIKEAELARARHHAERGCAEGAARAPTALLARKASSLQWPGSSVGYVLVAASSSAVTWVVSRATARRNGHLQQPLVA